MTQPTVSSTEGSNGPKDQASIPPGPPHHVTILNMHAIHSQTQNNTYRKMNLSTVKWPGPVRQNPIQRTAEFRLPRPRRAHGIPLRPAIPLRQFSIVITANSTHVTGSDHANTGSVTCSVINCCDNHCISAASSKLFDNNTNDYDASVTCQSFNQLSIIYLPIIYLIHT